MSQQQMIVPVRFQSLDEDGEMCYMDVFMRAALCNCDCGNMVLSMHYKPNTVALSQLELTPKAWRKVLPEFVKFLDRGKREGE